MQEQLGGRSRPRIGITGLWLTMLLFSLSALGGCDDTENCFPLGGSCSNASGFSDFFEQGVSCCEGSCVQLPGPQATAPRLCQ